MLTGNVQLPRHNFSPQVAQNWLVDKLSIADCGCKRHTNHLKQVSIVPDFSPILYYLKLHRVVPECICYNRRPFQIHYIVNKWDTQNGFYNRRKLLSKHCKTSNLQ